MQTIVTIDDQLFGEAQEVSSVKDASALMAEALKALIERENARHLAQLGGTMPNLAPISRRRSGSE